MMMMMIVMMMMRTMRMMRMTIVISISVEFGTITRIPNKKVRISMMTVVTMLMLLLMIPMMMLLLMILMMMLLLMIAVISHQRATRHKWRASGREAWCARH
jgi:hypothetical protein